MIDGRHLKHTQNTSNWYGDVNEIFDNARCCRRDRKCLSPYNTQEWCHVTTTQMTSSFHDNYDNSANRRRHRNRQKTC